MMHLKMNGLATRLVSATRSLKWVFRVMSQWQDGGITKMQRTVYLREIARINAAESVLLARDKQQS